MAKLLQNRIAESRMALPVMTAFTLLVWVLCGLLSEGWWLQLASFGATAFLMVELNNVHALIRIYSRMVSCAFLALSCCACFLFPSLRESAMLLCTILSYLVLFTTYQDKTSAGRTYYAFIFFGMATMAYIHVVFLLPVLWLLMGTNLMSLSWRTWLASILGILTPYWFVGGWLLFQQDTAPLTTHFTALGTFGEAFNLATLTLNQALTLAFVMLTAIIGSVHFVRKSYLDRIRTRMFFGIFIWMNLATACFLAVQPQHYDAMLRLMLLNTAPLAGHFLALSSTRLTNIAFFALSACAFALTLYNIWSTSYLF